MTCGERSEGVLAEYASLRSEIMGYQRDAMHILAFVAALSTPLLVYGMKGENPWVLLLVFLLCAPAFLLQVERLRSTYRIGRYIEVFLEGAQTGLHWETRWHRYKGPRPGGEGFGSFKTSVSSPIVLLETVSLAMSWVLVGAAPWWLIVVSIPALCVLVWETHVIRCCDDPEEPSRRWEQIREEEPPLR